MKKYILALIVFSFIIGGLYVVNAYSTSQYSIDIPFTYNKFSESSFIKENRNNINIKVTPYPESVGNPYTEEILNMLVEMVWNIDDHSDEMVNTLKNEYGNYLSDNEIAEYANSFKCNSVDKKEIITFTKNNYKCFHIIANYSMRDYSYYSEQYIVVSDNNTFTITISVNSKEDLESLEIKNMINSFTIYNYKEPSQNSSLFSSDLFSEIIAVVIVTTVCNVIAYVKSKNKNKNTYVEEKNNTIDDDKQLENLINNIEKENKSCIDSSIELKDPNSLKEEEHNKKYCSKCGNEIENNWSFCNYCGNKLK